MILKADIINVLKDAAKELLSQSGGDSLKIEVNCRKDDVRVNITEYDAKK